MPPAASPSGAIHRLWARFRDPAIEREFRDHHLDDQRRRGLAVAGLVTFMPLVILASEVQAALHGQSELLPEIVGRALVFVMGVVVLVFVKRARSPRALENLLTAFGMVVVVQAIGVIATHSQFAGLMPGGAVVGAALVYFFAPVQFSRTVLLATTLSVGGCLAWMAASRRIPADFGLLVLGLASVNLAGALFCRAHHRTLRILFANQKEAQRQKAMAESALARERVAFDQFKEFAELICHEFRNPLAIVKSKAQLLQLMQEMGRGTDPDAVPAIERAVNRLDALFNHWLKSDRLANETLTLDAQPLNLPDILAEAERTAPLSAHHPVLFDSSFDAVVMADPSLMQLVLSTVIDNAIKYSPDGGPILVAAQPRGGMAEIAVRDHGIGIPVEYQGKVFDKYFRVSHDGRTQGLGLGLYLARRIMIRHGGAVGLSSAPGQGTTVTLRLPLAAPAAGGGCGAGHA